MKRFILASYLFTTVLGVCAQKDDLKKLCVDYEHLLTGDKSFQLSYVLTVASSIDTSVEHMNFDLYKSNQKDCLKMGEAQVVIHDGLLMLAINNEARTIRFSDDSSNLNSKNVLVSDFTAIIDSSSAIALDTKDGKFSYTLAFPKTYGYSTVKFVFSKKTKHLLGIYAAFAPDYPSEFKSIEVAYNEPDFKWMPAANFPDTEKYITKVNGRYVIQEAYDGYKVF